MDESIARSRPRPTLAAMKSKAPAALAVLLTACGPAIPRMPPAPGSTLSVAAIRADSDRRFEVLLEGAGEPEIFSSYSPSGPVRWARNFTLRLDFTGVAWDDSRTATLVSPRHVVMAAHYQRPAGSKLSFHDRRGNLHTCTLIAIEKVSGADISVGLLDAPLPESVSYYRLLPPSPSNLGLTGCLAVVTDHSRRAHIHPIDLISGNNIAFGRPAPGRIPPQLFKPVIKGDSGNPSFLIVGGEMVLIETHSTGGSGAGPFYSEPANFAAINAAMSKLGGGHQLSVVPVRHD